MTLETVDSIRWDQLEDARGEAPVEVPEALRALAGSKKPTERKAAFSDLYEILTHDGDYLHPVAFKVTPFLLELFRSSQTPDRGLVLTLLVECVCGGSHRPFIARGGYDGAADDFGDAGDSVAQLRGRLASESATFRSLLADKSKRTRAATAHAIGFLPELSDGADLLLERLAKESDGVAAGQVILGLGRLKKWNNADSKPAVSGEPVVEWARRFASAHLCRDELTRKDALDLLKRAKTCEVDLYPSVRPQIATANFLANVAYDRGDAELLMALADARAIDPANMVEFAFTLALPLRDAAAGPVVADDLSPKQRSLLQAMGSLVREFSHAVPGIDVLGPRGIISETHFRRLAEIEDGPADAKAPNGTPHWFNAWSMLYRDGDTTRFVDAVLRDRAPVAVARDVASYDLVYGWPPDYSVPSADRRDINALFGRALREAFSRLDVIVLAREAEHELERAGRHDTLAPLAAAATMKGATLSDRLEQRLDDMAVIGDYESVRALLERLPRERREGALKALGFDETVRAANGTVVVDFEGAWPLLDCARTRDVLLALLTHLRTWNWDVLEILRGPDIPVKKSIESFVVGELVAFDDAVTLTETIAAWKSQKDLAPQVKLLERAATSTR